MSRLLETSGPMDYVDIFVKLTFMERLIWRVVRSAPVIPSVNGVVAVSTFHTSAYSGDASITSGVQCIASSSGFQGRVCRRSNDYGK